jgi:hypothetical protein
MEMRKNAPTRDVVAISNPKKTRKRRGWAQELQPILAYV